MTEYNIKKRYVSRTMHQQSIRITYQPRTRKKIIGITYKSRSRQLSIEERQIQMKKRLQSIGITRNQTMDQQNIEVG